MRTLRHVLQAFVLFALVSVARPVDAQQPAPTPAAVAAATELLGVLGMEKQFEAMLPMLLQQVRQIIVQANPRAAKDVDAVMPALTQKFSARKGDVVPLAAQIYARRLSVEDMQAMTAFFKTPAGQRFVESMPQLTQESMAVGQAWGRRLGEEVDRDMRQELRKRGVDI